MIVRVDNYNDYGNYLLRFDDGIARAAPPDKYLVEKLSATRPARPSARPTVRRTHTRAICPVIGGDPDLCVTDGRVPPVTSIVSLAAQTNTRVPFAAVFVSRKLCKILGGGVQTK